MSKKANHWERIIQEYESVDGENHPLSTAHLNSKMKKFTNLVFQYLPQVLLTELVVSHRDEQVSSYNDCICFNESENSDQIIKNYYTCLLDHVKHYGSSIVDDIHNVWPGKLEIFNSLNNEIGTVKITQALTSIGSPPLTLRCHTQQLPIPDDLKDIGKGNQSQYLRSVIRNVFSYPDELYLVTISGGSDIFIGEMVQNYGAISHIYIVLQQEIKSIDEQVYWSIREILNRLSILRIILALHEKDKEKKLFLEELQPKVIALTKRLSDIEMDTRQIRSIVSPASENVFENSEIVCDLFDPDKTKRVNVCGIIISPQHDPKNIEDNKIIVAGAVLLLLGAPPTTDFNSLFDYANSWLALSKLHNRPIYQRLKECNILPLNNKKDSEIEGLFRFFKESIYEPSKYPGIINNHLLSLMFGPPGNFSLSKSETAQLIDSPNRNTYRVLKSVRFLLFLNEVEGEVIWKMNKHCIEFISTFKKEPENPSETDLRDMAASVQSRGEMDTREGGTEFHLNRVLGNNIAVDTNPSQLKSIDYGEIIFDGHNRTILLSVE